MIIEQTIEIPASRHIVFDLPIEIPTGMAKAALTLTFENENLWKERARQAFLKIEQLRKKVHPNFDDAKELEAARNEKYSYFD